jgi:ABC-type transport system involved in cytochrome c biogenesis permease component
MINKVIAYFDLYSSLRTPGARAFAVGPTTPTNLWILAHFIALLVGIIAKPFVDAYQRGAVNAFQISYPLIIFSCIVAIAIFPAVFKNAYNKENPGFVQLCATFASGLGYQTLFTAATKAAGAA